jgi:nucleotide-binding universal stress UspA family protein
VLAEADTTQTCLAAAGVAADRLDDARIEALHVTVDPKALATSDEEVDIQMMRERREGTAADRAEAVRRQFLAYVAAMDDAGPQIDWRTVSGAEEPEVVRAADQADLVVMAAPHDLDGHDALHAALYRTGKPLLLVPDSWQLAAGAGERIAIYWDGDDGPTPALEAALPWLKRAATVTVLLIGVPVERSAWIGRWLDDQKIDVAVKALDRGDGSMEESVRAAAHDSGADLLVVGPRTHTALVGWFTGGATHAIVTHADLPILASH